MHRMKRQHTDWQQIYAKHVSDKAPEYRAYLELSKLDSKETTQLKMSKRSQLMFPPGRYTGIR